MISEVPLYAPPPRSGGDEAETRMRGWAETRPDAPPEGERED